ncbi:hypothetical protein IFR05_005581 [Cadophora sp. M221]|nr:hypothetical protein IFR05_005581 [Cadophora sp. M221]
MAQMDLPKNTTPVEGEQVKSTSTSKLPAWAAETKVTGTRAQPWKELAREETVTFGDGADQVDVLKGRKVTSGAMFIGSLAA